MDLTKKRISQLLRTLILATLIILATLANLVACSEPTPDPTATPAPAPASIAATPALPPNVPTQEGAATPTPSPEPTPTVRPTASPTTSPTSTPTPEPTSTQTPDSRLASLPYQDPEGLRAALSDGELLCLSDDPEELAEVLSVSETTSPEEYARRLGCLTDEAAARLFLTGLVPGSNPLSMEASNCFREAFEVIDPKSVMTADTNGDPERAMAGSMTALMVSLACLTDEEINPGRAIRPEDGAAMQCLVDALGGPGQMAEAVTLAQEGEVATFNAAAEVCGTEPVPVSSQVAVIPPPTLDKTVEQSTPTHTSTPTATATLVITVAEVPADIREYDRDEWKHWVDEDGDCQDARQEVLIEESLEAVTYETDRKCRVATGQWWAPHLGHHLGNPSHIDVDHHVPLKHAHLSGGWTWPPEMKEEYANYLEDPAHLVAISSRYNRSKGARGPEEWAPPDNALWCDYATDWTEIKERWGLTMTRVESEIVMDMLGMCEHPPEVDVRTDLGPATGEHKPEPAEEPQSSVYGSCEEAEAAGEQRVQGSQGGGQGFPIALVPSARDGDGDGVVCEK